MLRLHLGAYFVIYNRIFLSVLYSFSLIFSSFLYADLAGTYSTPSSAQTACNDAVQAISIATCAQNGSASFYGYFTWDACTGNGAGGYVCNGTSAAGSSTLVNDSHCNGTTRQNCSATYQYKYGTCPMGTSPDSSGRCLCESGDDPDDNGQCPVPPDYCDILSSDYSYFECLESGQQPYCSDGSTESTAIVFGSDGLPFVQKNCVQPNDNDTCSSSSPNFLYYVHQGDSSTPFCSGGGPNDAQTPADNCTASGGQYGFINGQGTCLSGGYDNNCASGESLSLVNGTLTCVTTPPITNGSPIATNNQSSSTTTTTTTTTTTITNADGSVTTVTESQTDEEGSGSASASEDCDAPPVTNDVDPALAAILKQQWIAQCTGDFEAPQGDGDIQGRIDDLTGELNDEIAAIQSDLQSMFGVTVSTSGSCSSNPQSIFGVTIDFSVCQWIGYFSIVGIVVMGLAAFRAVEVVLG